MNVKHWIMALVIALVGTAVAAAQEGESTMEGVPVVEELVTDVVAHDDSTMTSVAATARVGSWHITAYSDDSLMTHKTIELTEEMMDEFFDDMPGFFKGLLGLSGLGMASGAIFMVIVMLLCIFGLPLLLLALLLYLLFRRRRTDDQPRTTTPDEGSAPSRDRTLFNKGVKNICLGIGLAIFLGIWLGDFGVGIGILIVCIGIGEVLVDYLGKK
ncbi:MAG: hypothetical protein IKV15_10250 [Bacteroidaceae bacterium]|nr:hypothetical protein [Bacteroidaceae bacterium]